MFVFSGVSLWHHSLGYRTVNIIAGTFMTIFWMFSLKDFANHLFPFEANSFMLSLNIVVIHLMGLYKFLLLVSIVHVLILANNEFLIQLFTRKDHFEIVDFINSRQFMPDDEGVFAMRKETFKFNTKLLSYLCGFGWLAVITYSIFVTPLTQSQLKMEFPEGQKYLFILMYLQMLVSVTIASGMTMAASFYILSMINFVNLEFRVLAYSFEQLLSQVEDAPSEAEFNRVIGQMREYVKYYQKLLK